MGGVYHPDWGAYVAVLSKSFWANGATGHTDPLNSATIGPDHKKDLVGQQSFRYPSRMMPNP